MGTFIFRVDDEKQSTDKLKNVWEKRNVLLFFVFHRCSDSFRPVRTVNEYPNFFLHVP